MVFRYRNETIFEEKRFLGSIMGAKLKKLVTLNGNKSPESCKWSRKEYNGAYLNELVKQTGELEVTFGDKGGIAIECADDFDNTATYKILRQTVSPI